MLWESNILNKLILSSGSGLSKTNKLCRLEQILHRFYSLRIPLYSSLFIPFISFPNQSLYFLVPILAFFLSALSPAPSILYWWQVHLAFSYHSFLCPWFRCFFTSDLLIPHQFLSLSSGEGRGPPLSRIGRPCKSWATVIKSPDPEIYEVRCM